MPWIFIWSASPVGKIPVVTVVLISSCGGGNKRHRNSHGSLKDGIRGLEWVMRVGNLNGESAIFYGNLLIRGGVFPICIRGNQLYHPRTGRFQMKIIQTAAGCSLLFAGSAIGEYPIILQGNRKTPRRISSEIIGVVCIARENGDILGIGTVLLLFVKNPDA